MTSSWYRRNVDAMPSWPMVPGQARALLEDLQAATVDAAQLDKALTKLLNALTVKDLSLLERMALGLRYLRCLTVMSLIKRDSTGLASLDEVTQGTLCAGVNRSMSKARFRIYMSWRWVRQADAN
ncbi:MAG: hypothetical protein EBS61_06715 [Betaproteobacteria bacterium]|nr:hypothetical protein [Betaproteobacteria bacterium]